MTVKIVVIIKIICFSFFLLLFDRISRLKVPSNDINRARTQATMHCTSWRSDGSPSCLGGSSHWWVPVNTHSTPVPFRREAVGGSAQTHNTRQRQTMSPDLYPLRPVYAIAGKHNRIMAAEKKIGTAWSNDCEPMRISPVHQCRKVDDSCVYTCGANRLL